MDVRRPDTGGEPRRVGGSGEAVAALDATFSAPKSVSAAWALGSPELRGRIEAAHETAIDRALDYAGRHVPMLRQRVDRSTAVHAKAVGVVATSWRHTTARAVADQVPDPQLHSHVLLHAAHRRDGRLVAIDSRTWLQHQREVGAAYRTELARELAQLGFAVQRDTGRGERYFELAGVPQPLLFRWSSRHHQVQAAHRTWDRVHAQRVEVLRRQQRQPLMPAAPDQVLDALTEFDATFPAREARAVALERSAGAPIDDALGPLVELRDTGEILRLADGNGTTREHRAREHETISTAERVIDHRITALDLDSVVAQADRLDRELQGRGRPTVRRTTPGNHAPPRLAPSQNPPVGAGGLWPHLEATTHDQHSQAVLTRNLRARDPADGRDQARFRDGDHELAVRGYAARARVHTGADLTRAEDAALHAAHTDARNGRTTIVLAQTSNDHLDELNARDQAIRHQHGELGTDRIPAPGRPYSLHPGDQVQIRHSINHADHGPLRQRHPADPRYRPRCPDDRALALRAPIQRTLGVLGTLNILSGVALVAVSGVLAQINYSHPARQRALARSSPGNSSLSPAWAASAVAATAAVIDKADASSPRARPSEEIDRCRTTGLARPLVDRDDRARSWLATSRWVVPTWMRRCGGAGVRRLGLASVDSGRWWCRRGARADPRDDRGGARPARGGGRP